MEHGVRDKLSKFQIWGLDLNPKIVNFGLDFGFGQSIVVFFAAGRDSSNCSSPLWVMVGWMESQSSFKVFFRFCDKLMIDVSRSLIRQDR